MSPQMYLALKGGLVTTALVLGIIIAASGAMSAIMGLMIALGGGALVLHRAGLLHQQPRARAAAT